MASKHIIDHKPVSMTDDEWKLYNQICASYDNPPSQKGSDLFCDLFEVNGDGIIILLKPPKRQTSFEIVFFMSNLMVQQHLRLMQERGDVFFRAVESKIVELDKQLEEVKSNKKKKHKS